MTISSTSSRVVYSGDGTTSSFGFAFYVSDQADLVVTYTDTTGNQTIIAPGSAPAGYQISAPAVPAPGWPAGGTITYNPGSPIAAGTTLTIQRIVAGTQPTTLSNQGTLWPQVIEKALDRLVTIVQGFIDQVNRSLQAPANDPVTMNPLPTAATRQNTVLGFDNNGQPIAAAVSAGQLLSSFIATTSGFATASTAALAQAAIGLGVGSTIAATGNYTLPGGLIVKWGTSGSISSSGNSIISFAAAFPNAFFGALATPTSNTTGYTDTGGTSSFKIHNNGSNSATFFWLAVGN